MALIAAFPFALIAAAADGGSIRTRGVRGFSTTCRAHSRSSTTSSMRRWARLPRSSRSAASNSSSRTTSGGTAGWSRCRVEANGRHADPLFVDAEGPDFRLKPRSPALALGFEPYVDFNEAARQTKSGSCHQFVRGHTSENLPDPERCVMDEAGVWKRIRYPENLVRHPDPRYLATDVAPGSSQDFLAPGLKGAMLPR